MVSKTSILAFLGAALALEGPTRTDEFCSIAVNRLKNGFTDIATWTNNGWSRAIYTDPDFTGPDMVYWDGFTNPMVMDGHANHFENKSYWIDRIRN